jgi:hypothetical protein
MSNAYFFNLHCPLAPNIFQYLQFLFFSHSALLRGLSPQANYTDRVTAAVGEVVLTTTKKNW